MKYLWNRIGAWNNGPWNIAIAGTVTTFPLSDWFAVISCGTFPTPTPTSAERAYYAATYGLMGSL